MLQGRDPVLDVSPQLRAEADLARAHHEDKLVEVLLVQRAMPPLGGPLLLVEHQRVHVVDVCQTDFVCPIAPFAVELSFDRLPVVTHAAVGVDQAPPPQEATSPASLRQHRAFMDEGGGLFDMYLREAQRQALRGPRQPVAGLRGFEAVRAHAAHEVREGLPGADEGGPGCLRHRQPGVIAGDLPGCETFPVPMIRIMRLHRRRRWIGCWRRFVGKSLRFQN
mmetsp:Transcript_13039/g.33598  ORF Transcript_13039/g.33598 Transcript_13039/m.33598 type:complete len:222 (-) Transcript_13039:228-893(-)